MIRLLVSITICLIPLMVSAQMQNFTTVDPMTGRIQQGTVMGTPGGTQNYTWTNPYTGETTTGTVSPPMGGTSNFSTFNSQTGQVGVGSIQTSPPSNAPIFMPTPPPVGQQRGYGR